MKKIVAGVLFAVIAYASAVQGQGMSQGDVQNMMQAMQQMQECMAQIDQSELAALEQQGEEMDAEIKALCAQGKRDEAQEQAIAYSRKMMKNPALQQMKKCGEITKGLVPEGSGPSVKQEFDPSRGHVCDEQ